MNENRTVARWFGGILMVSAVVFGGVAPAEASDSGWNGTVAPATDVPVTTTTTDPAAATTTDPAAATTTDPAAATTTDPATATPTAPLGGLVVTPSFRDSGWNGT
ncbi:MAG TPA: hypothetical protein VM688_03615 [Nocardioidaceae bacterium]|jgi:hypothetical protein|nr:hypothetical protein [Nocardioidaceae bacterium]